MKCHRCVFWFVLVWIDCNIGTKIPPNRTIRLPYYYDGVTPVSCLSSYRSVHVTCQYYMYSYIARPQRRVKKRVKYFK